MAQPDGVFLQAFESVRSRHSVDEWLSMTPQRITAEIYQEMRRLDLIRAEELLRSGAKKKRHGRAFVTLHTNAGSRYNIRQASPGLRVKVA